MDSLELVSEPVRLRILRHLANHPDTSLSELARAVGVHVNTLRAHLRVLEEGGLVVRKTLPSSGRGRPQVRLRLAEGWAFPGTNFLLIAQILATVALSAEVGDRGLRRIGAAYGRSQSRHDRAEPGKDMARLLGDLGYEAEVGEDGLRLRGCPCPLVSPERPDVVCELAVGAIEGMLGSQASRFRLGRRDHDPSTRSCWVALRRPGASRAYGHSIGDDLLGAGSIPPPPPPRSPDEGDT